MNPTATQRIRGALAAGALFAALPALADTLHVDPVYGQSGAAGSSSAPLATVTEALSRLTGAGPHTIQLAAGTYSAASGESFPWSPVGELQLAGDPGGGSLLDLTQASGAPISATAFSLGSPTGGCAPRLRLAFVHVIGERNDNFSEGCAPITIEKSSFVGLGWVVRGTQDADLGQDIVFEDSLFEDIGQVSSNGGSYPHLLEWTRSTRCVYRACDVTNTSTHFYGPFWSLIEYRDCLITGMNDAGGPPDQAYACIADFIDGCTIIGNDRGGAFLAQDGHEIQNSILADNAGGDVWHGWASVRDSCVKDGSGQHLSGVIVGDPQLVDPSGGDFRPAFGSPVIDALAASAGRTDLRGQLRNVDGNLDLVGAGDMGAFEFRSLDRPHGLSQSLPLGLPYALELRGAPHSFTQILFTRAGMVAPTMTPYGALVLQSGGVTRIALVQLDGSGRATATVPMQGGPGLIGATLGFQSLGRSPAAPQGAAFSNGLELVVVSP